MSRFPFGIPAGWFAVAASQNLPKGKVAELEAFGQRLALYRGNDGKVGLLDGTCPHLGAQLAHGDVEGDTLRCPFHGFRFDGNGVCVANGYGTKAPPTAKVRSWPVVEADGWVLAWHCPEGKPPSWEVPALPSDEWSTMRVWETPLASHPQETTENSADLGHFTKVHHFTTAEIVKEFTTSGPHISTAYSVQFDLSAFGLPGKVPVTYDIDVWGLGFSRVHAHIGLLGLESRLHVLPMPVDGEHMILRLGTRVESKGWLHAWWRRIALEAVFHGYCSEVEQDRQIWETKAYIERPALAKGDGPISKYRRWAKQFYPAPA